MLDRPLIARVSALGFKPSPPLLLLPVHLLLMLGVALLLVLPSTLVIGFALRVPSRVCLPWGFSIAALLTATFVWFMTSHTVRFVTMNDGVLLEVLDSGGTGRPMIFLSPLGPDGHEWDTFDSVHLLKRICHQSNSGDRDRVGWPDHQG